MPERVHFKIRFADKNNKKWIGGKFANYKKARCWCRNHRYEYTRLFIVRFENNEITSEKEMFVDQED